MSWCKDCDSAVSYSDARSAGFGGSLRCPNCGSYDVME